MDFILLIEWQLEFRRQVMTAEHVQIGVQRLCRHLIVSQFQAQGRHFRGTEMIVTL
ncbi:hypothetical protein D3C86_2235070 [compost metagenome]